MSSTRRKRLSDGYRDTAGSINRTTTTLLITCLSAVILNGVDDTVILGNETVSTPFVGQTRYELFVLLAPALITALRFYIDLQVMHLTRLGAIMRHFKIATSITLSPSNNSIIWFAGVCMIHIAPPATIVMIGYHASAIYPITGLILYGWAAVLLAWSVVLTFRVARHDKPSFAFAATSALSLVIAITVLVDREDISQCARRYEGFAEAFSHKFLRQVDLSRADLSMGYYKEANLSCGDMENTEFNGADVRNAMFWSANLHGANLAKSKFAYAEFHRTRMRQTVLKDAEGPFAEFIHSELDRSDLSGARLNGVVFNHADVNDAKFDKAIMDGSFFYKADISFASFRDADLRNAEFYEAELFDVNFTGATLNNARFDDAEITDGTFSGADLQCTSFAGATLQGVDFSGVDPEKLRGAQFPDAGNMTDVKWPAGYDLKTANTQPNQC